MASVRQFPGSKFWYACFSDGHGRRVQRSTRKEKRKDAQKVADGWEELYRSGLTARQAHKVIADLYKDIHGEELAGSATVRSYFEDWLKRREGEISKATLEAYQTATRRFLEWLGERADRMLLIELEERRIQAFRSEQQKRVAPRTVNQNVKILRIVLEDALREKLISENPAKNVKLLKEDKSTRRPLTLDEIRRILVVASDEWRSLITFGLYTGQRLADIATLSWNNVDLQAEEIVLTTRKTGRVVRIPICRPLAAHIDTLPSSDVPNAPLHPRASAIVSRKGSGAPLSREFGDMLVAAGLVPASRRSNVYKGVGG